MSRERPRILIDSTPLRGESVLHGIGRYVYDVLQGLADTKREWEGELFVEALVDLPWVRRAEATTDLADVAERARTGPRDRDWRLVARRWTTLARVAIERRVDVVHMPQARGVPLWLPTRSVVTCYDVIPLRYPKEYLGSESQRISRWVRDFHRYRMPTRVACISQKTATDLALLGVPSDRIDVVTTGVDLAQWSTPRLADDAERRSRLGVGSRRYVLYVGDCDYRKNVRGMFASLALARREEDVELVWAGDLRGPKAPRMKALAAEYGVGDAVRFLGYVADADLGPLYRDAVALLFISRLEGFGLPVAEAMSARCPTIVASDSGCDEVAGDAAIVVGPDDSRAAAEAILRLMRSEETRHDLARRGVARVSRFDRREMARGYVTSFLHAARPLRGGRA